jgi:hypothetical protein
MFPLTVFALYEKLNTMNNCIVPFIDKEFAKRKYSQLILSLLKCALPLTSKIVWR